ncbi:MAG: RbsD/FucU domain-containing protein [Acidobacteriaceae bacterium]
MKTLSALHTPELLHALASMGHGDELALVDANFPSASSAQRLVRLDGSDLPSALEAILQLVPLDTFVDDPAQRMMQVHAPDTIPEVQQICQRIVDKVEGRHIPLAGICREQFYERARKAFVVVATSERRTYGCLLIRKGVVYLASEKRLPVGTTPEEHSAPRGSTANGYPD